MHVQVEEAETTSIQAWQRQIHYAEENLQYMYIFILSKYTHACGNYASAK